MPLNAKQQRFVEEYCVDCNGTQAAIRSGYSAKTAAEQAYDLLRLPHVADAIADLNARHAAKLAERSVITKEWVVQQARETYEEARADAQFAAAKANLDLVARLHGYIIEKRDLRLIKSITDLTDEELAAIAAGSERDKAVGTRH